MHIAFFTDTFAPQTNGVATVVANLARELAGRGHKVTVGTVSAPVGSEDVDAAAEKDGYTVVRYPSTALPTYKEMRVAVPTVLKSLLWAQKHRPDMIHVHTNFGMGWEGVALAKTLEVPLVGTHHTFLRDYAEHVKLDEVPGADALAHRLVSSFFNRCQIVTAPSKAMLDDLRECGVTVPIELLRNPVDVERFTRAPEQRDAGRTELSLKGPTAVYWGRVSFEKNLPVLLRAAAPVLQENPDARLLVIGDGPKRLPLQTLAEAMDLDGQVLFTGRLVGEPLVRAVGAADVFASASLTENQPVSVIEAHAAGLPTVVFAERGMPEIVQDGVNGRVVKTGDVAGFTAALRELLADAALRKRLGEAAKANAAHFAVASVVDDLMALYERHLP